MKAVVRYRYGSLDALELVELPAPVPGAGQVLIRVRAVSLNTSDVEFLTGRPLYARLFGFFKPKFPVLGTDVAGVVEAVGPNVSRFRPGDEVMGDILGFGGALAELVAAPEERLMQKPAGISFEEAACLPQAGAIAYQGIIDPGGAALGKRVLINGAGGGSGTLAIQLAKALGAEVTGVDNTYKQGLLREVGADHAVDYTRDDFTRGRGAYDLILDLVGSRSLSEFSGVLAPGGKYWMVGGPMRRLISVLALGRFHSRAGSRLRMLAVEPNRGVAELLERRSAGTLRPIIGGHFPLARAREAIEQVATGRALGKLVVQIQ